MENGTKVVKIALKKKRHLVAMNWGNRVNQQAVIPIIPSKICYFNRMYTYSNTKPCKNNSRARYIIK